MFPGLGHDAFVGGNDQRHQVDAGSTGHHVLDEFFVARHIHDAQGLPLGKFKVRKPQFDGDATLLLFLQTVCVDPVRALMREVFPWSMWPAVPRMFCLISGFFSFPFRKGNQFK